MNERKIKICIMSESMLLLDCLDFKIHILPIIHMISITCFLVFLNDSLYLSCDPDYVMLNNWASLLLLLSRCKGLHVQSEGPL